MTSLLASAARLKLELMRPLHAVRPSHSHFAQYAAANLHLSPDYAEQKIWIAVVSVWSLIDESKSICKVS